MLSIQSYFSNGYLLPWLPQGRRASSRVAEEETPRCRRDRGAHTVRRRRPPCQQLFLPATTVALQEGKPLPMLFTLLEQVIMIIYEVLNMEKSADISSEIVLWNEIAMMLLNNGN